MIEIQSGGVEYTLDTAFYVSLAAEELFISQPAVSKHVNALETAYGVTLFNRRGSRLCLTAAGEVLLGCAERLEAEYRHLQYAMSRCTERLEGELRLGASTTVAQYLLPPILARFTACLGQQRPD